MGSLSRLTRFCSFLCALSCALPSLVGAQGVSDDLRRKVLERKRQQQKNEKPKKQEDRKSADDRRICESRERIISQNQSRLESYQSEVIGIDAEIAQLQERLKVLAAEKRRAEASVQSIETRVKRDRDTYRSTCSSYDECSRYVETVNRLEKDSSLLEDDASQIRREISESQKRLRSLRRSIEPLRQEYSRLKCDNLVPGSTAQSTIDRCASIFSTWNRRQAELNRDQQLLPSLRHRYETVLAQVSRIDSRVDQAEQVLASQCKSAPKPRGIQVVHQRRERVRGLGRELNQLAQTINELRDLRITVTVR